MKANGKLYVGTWSLSMNPMEKGGYTGIYVFEQDGETGALTEIQHCVFQEQASYIALSPDGNYLYATNEDRHAHGVRFSGGSVLSFAIDPDTGMLTQLGDIQSLGTCPTYLTVDRGGRYLFLVNHAAPEFALKTQKTPEGFRLVKVNEEGNAVVFPLLDGIPQPASDVYPFQDVSVTQNPGAMGTHPHCCVLDPTERFLLVCEKGGDRIYVFEVDYVRGTLVPARTPYKEVNACSAPRYLVFHPKRPWIYVTNESDGTISGYCMDPETSALEELFCTGALADGLARRGHTACDLQLDQTGKHLYVTVHGGMRSMPGMPESYISVFDIDQDSGAATLKASIPFAGNNPRSICFDGSGRFLYAASLLSGEIVCAPVDSESGLLGEQFAAAQVEKPSSIKFW